MLCLLLRKLYSFTLLFLTPNSILPLSSLTTSLLLCSQLIINIITIPNILICTIISFVGLSKKIKFDSYIVSLQIWSLIYLWRHSHLSNSSILQVFLVSVQLEEKCKKITSVYCATVLCAHFVISYSILNNCFYFICILFAHSINVELLYTFTLVLVCIVSDWVF